VLPESAQPQHLIHDHDYIDLAGIVMPPTAGMTCLWDRVFATGDSEAHNRLYQRLASGQVSRTERALYVVALEAELFRRADLLLTRRSELVRLVRCLRQNEAARAHFWQLLPSTDRRVREVARELVLPELSETRACTDARAADVQRLLDKLAPVDDVQDKIRICQRLPQFGVSPSAVSECLRRLRGGQTLACPECAALVLQDELENHLRRVHRLYQFRGVRRSLAETAATLFSAVCGAKPDPDAWQAVASLAHEEYGSEAEGFLAMGVTQALKEVDQARRAEAVRAAAEAIAVSGSGSALASFLALSKEPLARQLALHLAMLLASPLNTELVTALLPLLARKRAPRELQIAAATALLRTTGTDGPGAREVVNALVAGGGKARAVDRLNELEAQAGPCPLIAERRAQIENRIRMRCPRCGVQLRRLQMAEHLWAQHALLLDGRRVREPWRLVEDWIAEYRRHPSAPLFIGRGSATPCFSLPGMLRSRAPAGREHARSVESIARPAFPRGLLRGGLG
jgi:hypothetical protein